MRLSSVALREEVRRWSGAALLGGEGRRTWIVTLRTDTGREASGEVAWLPRAGEQPDVEGLLGIWAWGRLGRPLPDATDPTALPASLDWAVTAALADLQAGWDDPEELVENGLLTAPSGTPEEVARAWSARMAASPGIRTWKVKVGRVGLAEDLARLRACELPAGVLLRLDPNRGWGEHDPTVVAAELADLPLDYVEEPVGWPELAAWAAAGVPCAADESVLDVPISTLADAGIRAVVLKPSVLGGLAAVQSCVRTARDRGLDVVVSSSLEGPVGRRHLERLVGTLETPAAAAGLARDVLCEPPGIGPERTWSLDLDPLRDLARRSPDGIAFETPDETWSFADWDAAADREAAWLGDRRHERIAVEIDGPAGAAVLFGVLRSGAIACIVPPGVQRATAMEQVGAMDPSEGSGTPPGLRHGGPATLLWSSGSQGVPRAIAHTLGQHLSRAAASHLHAPFGPGDRWLVDLRMHHVGGLALLFRALHGGGTVVWPGDRPLPITRPTHISWVPTQLGRSPATPPSSVRHVLVGGAAAPPGLVADKRASGWPVQTTYGSTETASQVCTSTPTGDVHGSGRPLPGTRVQADPAIRVWAASTSLGVWEGGTLRPLTDAAGWLTTGDVGRIAADGTLYVEGRADAMFVSGGENVFPEAIERVLGDHPAVRSVVVVDVPDPEWGARPWAFVDGDLSLDAARAHLADRLPRYAWVDRVLPWTTEGVGSTGKPRRAWLRARAQQLRRDGGPGSP